MFFVDTHLPHIMAVGVDLWPLCCAGELQCFATAMAFGWPWGSGQKSPKSQLEIVAVDSRCCRGLWRSGCWEAMSKQIFDTESHGVPAEGEGRMARMERMGRWMHERSWKMLKVSSAATFTIKQYYILVWFAQRVIAGTVWQSCAGAGWPHSPVKTRFNELEPATEWAATWATSILALHVKHVYLHAVTQISQISCVVA